MSVPLLTPDSPSSGPSHSLSPLFQGKTIQVVHRAEVHNTPTGDGTSTHPDEDFSTKTPNSGKKKKKLKRKNTFLLAKSSSGINQKSTESLKKNSQKPNSSSKKIKSGTETFSEGSSSPNSDQIKLIPLLGKEKRKKPSGYATETLSEDSDLDQKIMSQAVVSGDRDTEDAKSTETTEGALGEGKTGWEEERSRGQEEKEEAEVKEGLGRGEEEEDLMKETGGEDRELRQDVGSDREVRVPPSSPCTSSSMDYKDMGLLTDLRLKRLRKKKKIKEDSINEKSKVITAELKSPALITEQKCPEKVAQKFPDKLGEFICLTLHHCEPLKRAVKPYAKAAFMEIEGKLKTNSKGEPLNPLISKVYNIIQERSATPTWNEDLILTEPLSTVLTKETLLFIELFDEENGKMIAWCFLKPVAANGALNVDQKLRLQLFKVGKSYKDTSIPEAYHWWKKGIKKKYKSTLYLTLCGIPDNLILNNKFDSPNKKMDLLQTTPICKSTENLTEEEDLEVKWSRLPGLSCKLPNKYLARLPAAPDGSLALAYSHSGLLLASATRVNVLVYTFKGRLFLSLTGHSGLVYDLKWSHSDKYLLSASADFSSCVWDVSAKLTNPIQVLSHPSYVYSCTWLDKHSFATGCFDGDIRVWGIVRRSAGDARSTAPTGEDRSQSVEQIQHCSRHRAEVNCVLASDERLISADSLGFIFLWKRRNDGKLEFEKELSIREIKGKVINKISLHPNKKRLLVHTRDSTLRMVDLTSGAVLLWFEGLVNRKLRQTSGFCGCGSLVLAWSEDGTLACWDGHTASQVGLYPLLGVDFRPGVFDFHPHDHMMAVCGLSSHSPTLSILLYDRKSTGQEVGLVLLNRNMNRSVPTSDSTAPSRESTPKKKETLLKTLLGSRRKMKKDTSTHETVNVSNISEIAPRRRGSADLQRAILDTEAKENRLTEIIQRMDQFLITAVSLNNTVDNT